MKLALVSQPWNDPTPPVRSGSIPIWVDRVARELAPHCEIVVYGRSRTGKPEQTMVDGVLHRRVPAALDLRAAPWLRRVLRSASRPYFARAVYFAGYMRGVARDAARLGCTHAHGLNFSQLVPALRRHSPATRRTLHMQCDWLVQLDRALVAPRVAACDRIVGCSDYVVDNVRRAFPELADRCRTVPNGVDIEHFAPRRGPRPAGGPRIVYLGRVSPEKGIDVLLDALPAVLARYPDARLEIIGPAALAPARLMVFRGGDPELARRFAGAKGYTARLRALVARGLGGRVDFRGTAPHAALPAALAAADVAVIPSVWQEPFGMAVIECMACGLPVIGSRVGGIPEILDYGRAGMLVPPGDPAALAAALLELLGDPARCAALSAAGRARVVARYTWSQVADAVLELHRELG